MTRSNAAAIENAVKLVSLVKPDGLKIITPLILKNECLSSL